MKIKRINIKNYLGIDELNWSPSEKANYIRGPKGSGKSSILESIEKSFSNKGRRTELIKHGEDEATLYIETTDGLEIDRRLRREKADYLRLKKEGEGVESTERELRQFLQGDIFRPLDFINQSEKEQTELILSMIHMDYSEEDIAEWFKGEVPRGINWDKHVLQVLKDIETRFYDQRQEINREIRTLLAQAEGIEKGLPKNYDGEKWEKIKVQDYYNAVAEANKKNNIYEAAKALREGFNDKVKAIEGEAEIAKADIVERYAEIRHEEMEGIKELKDIIKGQEDEINCINGWMDKAHKENEAWLNDEIAKLKEAYFQKAKAINEQGQKKKDACKESIHEHEVWIAEAKTKLKSYDGEEKAKLEGVVQGMEHRIALERERLGKAETFLETAEPIDVEPLQAEADHVAEMQGYLREWDRMTHIVNKEIGGRTATSELLTDLIEIARTKPSELITKHPLPIEGITVDKDGRIRINETLLDGLSEGEQLEVAIKIALQRAGELKVICLDGFHNLNPQEQEKLIDLCDEYGMQAFITITEDSDDGKFHIEQE